MMSRFESAIIEISGKCNARCKWCVTGRSNRYGEGSIKECLSLERFKAIYGHLIHLGAISKKTDLMLYSWGEPFLNPEAEEIFSYLSDMGQSYSLSTNGSVYKGALNDRTYSAMSSVTFSLPGFSQGSYDKIHGFDLGQVCGNIRALLADMRKNGFAGSAIVVFHVYQFNQHEITQAREFAERAGAIFVPYYAYFNGLSLAKKYVDGMFSQEEQAEISNEICLHYVDKRKKEIPMDFKCPLSKILTIDEKGRLVICCAADDQTQGYVLGDILCYDSTEEIESRIDRAMMDEQECLECQAKGLDAWLTKYERWDG